MRGFGVPVCEWPSSCLLFSLLFFPCTRSGGKNLIILLFAESNRKRPLVYFCSLGLSLKQILDSQLQSARDPGFLESVIPPGPVCTPPPGCYQSRATCEALFWFWRHTLSVTVLAGILCPTPQTEQSGPCLGISVRPEPTTWWLPFKLEVLIFKGRKIQFRLYLCLFLGSRLSSELEGRGENSLE